MQNKKKDKESKFNILIILIPVLTLVIIIVAYKYMVSNSLIMNSPGTDLGMEYEFDVFTKESLTEDEMAEIAKTCGCYIKEIYNDTHCLMAYKKNGYTDEKLDETIKQLRVDDRVASASRNPSSRMEDDDPTDDEIIEIITLTPEAEN